MAEIPANGAHSSGEMGNVLGAMANWTGAAISVALVIGAGVWGYQLLQRDVSGVPVVRALEGPMREQPEDPGGSQAAHQGLSVNNVAAEGTAGAPADRLVLAPPPISLDAEDTPLQPAVAIAPAPAASQLEATPVANTQPEIQSPEPIVPGSLFDMADGVSIGEEQTPPAPEPVSPAPTPVVSSAPVTEGLGRSLRPRLRPAGLREAALAAAAPSADTPAAPAEVDAASIASGTRLVQLGAFASEEIARAEWGKLQTKFGDYLGDKKRVIQKANSGGRVFYRLRAMGFADLSDARRLCSALKAENADCIPVVTR